jgi:hypothetical protein
MYNLATSARILEKTTSAALAALAAVSPATAGNYFWIFEQESPPVWELFYEVDLGNVCEIGLRPHNLFSACDIERGHAVYPYPKHASHEALGLLNLPKCFPVDTGASTAKAVVGVWLFCLWSAASCSNHEKDYWY